MKDLVRFRYEFDRLTEFRWGKEEIESEEGLNEDVMYTSLLSNRPVHPLSLYSAAAYPEYSNYTPHFKVTVT